MQKAKKLNKKSKSIHIKRDEKTGTRFIYNLVDSKLSLSITNLSLRHNR